VHLFLGPILLGVFLTLWRRAAFHLSELRSDTRFGGDFRRRVLARFAGVALISAGVGLWIRQTVRPAALLSGTMIFIWSLIVHIPRAAAGTGNMMEWSGVFESLAIPGIAFLVAPPSQALGATTTAPGQGDDSTERCYEIDGLVAAGRREPTVGTTGATHAERRGYFALHALGRPITSRSIAIGARNRT
jgi:hypothetical protein